MLQHSNSHSDSSETSPQFSKIVIEAPGKFKLMINAYGRVWCSSAVKKFTKHQYMLWRAQSLAIYTTLLFLSNSNKNKMFAEFQLLPIYAIYYLCYIFYISIYIKRYSVSQSVSNGVLFCDNTLTFVCVCVCLCEICCSWYGAFFQNTL